MEPLAERIRQDQQITGITIGEQYKLNLFADDLLMYLNNFDESIQPLLTIFNEYSMVSGYKINLGKTEVMAVGKSKNTVNTLRQAFKWTSKIKYLGCNINISKKQIYNDNYIPLLNSMQSKMNKWSNLPLNITGRINLFKINSSKFFFFFFPFICAIRQYSDMDTWTDRQSVNNKQRQLWICTHVCVCVRVRGCMQLEGCRESVV